MVRFLNKIHNYDNRDILKQLPDKSVQVFLEDMPYGTTKLRWDIMPDLQEYWKLRLSKIKDNGCFVLFCDEPKSSYLRISNIKDYRYDWIWKKQKAVNFFSAYKQPLKSIENICVFYKKQCIYNPQKRKSLTKKGFVRKTIYNHHSGIVQGSENLIVGNSNKYSQEYNLPHRILYYSVDVKQKIHPTQKPVSLVEYLILTYSNENDLIFDGFSGSGTTAIAAYNLNRNFICCELNKDYYEKSISRLNKIQNNLFNNLF